MHTQIILWLNNNPIYRQAIEDEIRDILSKYAVGIQNCRTSHEIVGYFYNQKSVEALSQLLSIFSNNVRWNISAYIGVIAQNMTGITHTTKQCPVTGVNQEDAWYL